MARPIQVLPVSAEQKRALRQVINAPSTPQRDVRRAWIILNRAEGLSQAATAARVGVRRRIVSHWEKRFVQQGLAGLQELRRSGRKPRLSERIKAQIITTATRPPPGRTRWSTRAMARAQGVSNSTVQKLWQANEIKPHLTRTFKLSKDPQFEPKFWDVIGLYLNPPDRALVLCCDEKSQCQALERTQPGLPLGVGHLRTRTHDYTRHGTLTLFAALNYLDGHVFRQVGAKHTHVQWLAFLKQLDRETPESLTLHLIIDNYATHKHPKVKSWIRWRNQRHEKTHGLARLALHFTPTSSSWMNLVERFFRDLTEDVVREGSFTHVRELTQAIEHYLAERDLTPKRYVWKAQGQAILDKIHRARLAAQAST
jgi:transposase